MDDFGSGYSSLKALNRFLFNLINMDMEFFRHFDERSKAIVTSIVTMSKRLGIHTLAEGVETQEQADFLRQIGCERIQGYFYGRPVQGPLIRSTLVENGLQIENPLEESMYGRAGLEDLVTSEPGALVLFENETLRILSCNDAFRREMESAGIDSALEVSRTVNKGTQLHYQKLLLYLQHVYDGETQPFVMVVNGNYLRVHASFVSGIHDRWVASVHILNISMDQNAEKIRRDDHAIRNMALLFDGIYFLNLEEDMIEVDACIHPQVAPGSVFHRIRDSFVSYCRELIHLEDQERFLDFIDENHILLRTASSERGFLADAFRVRREGGAYRWTLFFAIPLEMKSGQNILVCEAMEFFDSCRSRRDLLEMFLSSFDPGMYRKGGTSKLEETYAAESGVMKAFIRFAGIPLFWKDRQGRYIGINNEMLTFLGRDTKSEVIGKTAGELGLFVDPEDLKTENERVLKSGETIHFSPLMVSDKISRRVPVTEFPWYRGNQIHGTAGWIHIGEAVREQSFINDAATGFLGEHGGLLAGSTYADAYQRSGQDYCAFYLALRDAGEVNRVFGNAFFDKIVSVAAERLHQISLPEGTSVVHLRGFRFLLIGFANHEGDLIKAVAEFQREIQDIREIDGVECHLEMCHAMASGSESKEFADLIRILEERMHGGGQSAEQMEELIALHQNMMISPELLDTSPERIMLIDPESDDVLFMNRAMKRDLNLPETFSESGKKCYSLLNGRDTPCAFCQNSTMCFNQIKAGRARFHANDTSYTTREIMIRWKGRMARMFIGILDEERSDSSFARD
ncbi:MAG: EAL domain-containing protein, partial [Eubacterium sp.]|nr:EAL domain-containing protein [Eubacterium sp.]